MFKFYDSMTSRLRACGDYVWPLALRVILAWEFWESGITKLNGENRFVDIPWADWQKGFPLPFDLIPNSLNWTLATWGELGFAGMLLIGLFTRFAAFSLVVITAVATAAVHWPAEWGNLGELWNGYVITAGESGNYKLPLLFVVMLLPLVFSGGGKLSVDHLLLKLSRREHLADDRTSGLQSGGLALMVLSLVFVWLEPAWGFSMAGLGLVLLIVPEFTGHT